MTPLQKRFALFLIGCMGIRIALALFAMQASPSLLRIMGYIALLPALGFTLIYFFDLRKTGAEVFGAPIWWNSLRPVHAILYFLFAYMAINERKEAWYVLLADVAIGFAGFVTHHYAAGNFAKVLTGAS